MQTLVKGLRLANLNDVVGGNDEYGGEMADMTMSDAPSDMTMSDMPMGDTFGDTTSSSDAMTHGDPITMDTMPMPMGDLSGDDSFATVSGETQTADATAFMPAVQQGDDQPNVLLANAVPQTQQRPDVDAIQQYLQQPRDLLRVDPQEQRLFQEQRDRAIDRVEAMDRQNYVDRQNLPADVEQRVQEQIRREPVLTNPTQQDPFTVPGLPPRWDKGRPHGYDLGRPGNPFGPVGPRLVPPGR